MNLNCLTCQLSRTSSDNDLNGSLNQATSLKPKFKPTLRGVAERSFSGNLVPRAPYNNNNNNDENKQPRSGVLVAAKKVKKKSSLHRVHNSGPVEFGRPDSPRLVRSGGLRRDWSFEDLKRTTPVLAKRMS